MKTTGDMEYQIPAPPALSLAGLELPHGWTVQKRVERPQNATGGHFSHGYIARHINGAIGYLKALDIRQAMQGPEPMASLNLLTQSFHHECELCLRCGRHSLSRVVRSIAQGTVHTNPQDPYSLVPYLIFEMAQSDIRHWLDFEERFDLAWLLRVGHHVAVGLSQLHRIGIAHQDLKPSNVLFFHPRHIKIADLGRASARDLDAPHDSVNCAGHRSYAPPELLYGHMPQDWATRRFGCDAYLLGSFLCFLLTRLNMTGLLAHYIPTQLRWTVWAGPYADVLPFLQDAFGRALDAVDSDCPPTLRPHLRPMVAALCDPDPMRRGHPVSKRFSGNPYALDRFISELDLLAAKAECGLLGRP